MLGRVDDARAANRAWWDERVPLHLASRFYDLEGARAGRLAMRRFEVEEVGDVRGRDLAHLQCHIGTDTLAWALLGARVTGLDFSARAVEAATALARDLGLEERARFVCAPVEEARAALEGDFDVVYTSWGAINWLPDLDAWAGVVASLLRPGGILYLAEGHPLTGVLERRDGALVEAWPYQGGVESVDQTPGSYAAPEAVTRNDRSHEWAHGLGEVVTAVAGAGLRVEMLQERREILYQALPEMERGEDGTWTLPGSSLPFSFSLRARLRA